MPYKRRRSSEAVLICESAVVVKEVILGAGVNIWHHAVLRGDEGTITVGENTNIQDHTMIHGTVTLGSGCTIGHGVIMDVCTVGDNTLVGMGAILLNGAKVGKDCIVGAGAVVTGKMDAPDGSMILGSPAKVVRPLTAEEIEGNRRSAQEYLDLAAQYRKE